MKSSFYSPKEGKILSLNKPEDWTSFDVVNKIRRMTGITKVGHAGTLDPFATGVLLICLGPATKKSTNLMNLPKEYIAEIALGKETDTLDPTGKVVSELPIPELAVEEIDDVLQAFVGDIEQEIPAYSAAKHKGQRLYKMARKGKEVPQLFKQVTIYEIELLDWRKDFLRIRTLCSRGTYVRMLARDIAKKLHTAGYLKTLVRTRIGDYKLEDTLTIEELQHQLKLSETHH